jgi:hypothetical protein
MNSIDNVEILGPVRRKSDGKIFKIGDEARIKDSSIACDRPITRFDIYQHPQDGYMIRAILDTPRSAFCSYEDINELI